MMNLNGVNEKQLEFLDKPISNLTGRELLQLFSNNLTKENRPEETEKKYAYGISGLAEILNCSVPTAQKIKNSGSIPYSQAGRKIIFDAEKVLKAFENSVQKKGGK